MKITSPSLFRSALAISLVAALFSACRLDETNINPNVPDDVPMQTLLPPAAFKLARAQGGRAFRYSNIFSQHLKGTNNQELAIENYAPDELFVGYLWDDFYTGPMVTLRILIDKAEETDSPHYSGVGKVLLANSIGMVSDFWGDVPFSEALDPENLQAAYDPQSMLYPDIIALLDEAVEDLQAPESVFSPANDDVLYQGDRNKWIKAAMALKARYLLRQSNVNPAAVGQALAAAEQGFSNSFDDLAYRFLGSDVDANPIYQYYQITPNAIIGSQFIGIMGISDPRFENFIDIIPFSGGESKVGAALASPDSPLRLMSFVEQGFIKAECLLRGGQTPAAEAELQAAITESILLNTFGEVTPEEASEYAEDFTFSGDFEADLNTLMRQKYVALFTTPEPWADFRRTGYPEITPTPGAVSAANPNGEIPRRLMYPQFERLLNPNVPSPLPNMQSPMWWE